MLATLQPSPLDLWRERLGGRRRLHRQPRPWAALGYLANGPVIEGLIEIERLVLVALYDEPIGRGQHALRLAGFSGTRDPWGVRFGGTDQCRFFKDMLLQPMPGARGLRLDAASSELLSLGLRLDRTVECHARHRLRLKRHMRLPPLWAGFRRQDEACLRGEGPEFEQACTEAGVDPQQLLAQVRRQHFGLAIYPLAWLSGQAKQAVAVFADLAAFPLRHAFQLANLRDGLTGFQNAIQFDFFSSRFRGCPQRRLRRSAKRRAPALAAA